MEEEDHNCNTLWMDALRLAMTNTRIAFEIYNGDPQALKKR